MTLDVKKLSPKEESFCINYLLTNNGAKAARLAKYPELSARQTAVRLLAKAYIQERIVYLKAITGDNLDALKADKEERLRELAVIIRHPIEKPVTAGHIVAAIKENNMMEHVYDSLPPGFNDNRTIIINVTSKEAEQLINQVGSRTKQVVRGTTINKEGTSE